MCHFFKLAPPAVGLIENVSTFPTPPPIFPATQAMKTTISLAAFIAGASAASSPQSVAQSFRDGLDAALQRDTMAKAHRSLHALISSNAHTKAMNEGFKIARNQPYV